MTAKDTITLPREVVQEALEAFEAVRPFSTTQRELKIRAVEALRTALAAEQPSEDIKALRRENERLREALEKIATVNAMDYEYVRWAKAALRREDKR